MAKRLPRLRKANRGIARWAVTGTSFAPSASDRTARKAGTRLINTTVWNVGRFSSVLLAWAIQTTPKAISNPSTAPPVSAARWKPKASPRWRSSMLSATSASRGAVRMPLPTRSAQRTPATAPQELAK